MQVPRFSLATLGFARDDLREGCGFESCQIVRREDPCARGRAHLPQSAVIVMLARSAAAITFSPSSRRHLPASIARQIAPAAAIVSTVLAPMTGTSKRMSWFGFATLTT